MKNEPCSLPFNQLYLHSSGNVYPCGFLQNNIYLGSVKKQSLKDIWEGKELSAFRSSHESGTNKECLKNQKLYNCNKIQAHIVRIKEVKLRRIDFMIDSKCNLKCIMCTNILEENGGFESEEFWNELEQEILPKLDEIELIGGEPFIVSDTYKLFDLVLKVKPNIKLRITTNAMYSLTPKISSYLKRLNIYSLAVSIDSLNPIVFEKIRAGGAKLELLLRNLDLLIELKAERSFYLICNSVIQKANSHEVPRLIDFCKERGIGFYPILLREPKTHSILSCSEQEISNTLYFYLKTNINLKSYELFSLSLKIFKELSAPQKLNHIEQIEKQRAIFNDK